MNKFIAHKLRDERGVTILMALFAYLVAAMVCVVILGAAASSVRQAKLDQQHQQDMLLLQSAADLITNEVENTTVSKTQTTTKKYKNNYNDELKSSETTYSFIAKDSAATGDSQSSTLVSDTLLNAIKSLYPGDSTASVLPGKAEFTLTVAAGQGTDGSFSQDVNVLFTYVESKSGSENKWRFTLSTKGADERGDHTLYIDFNAPTNPSYSPNPTEYDTHNRPITESSTCTWTWTASYYSSTEDGLGEKDAS